MRISSQQIFSGGISRLQNLNSNLQKTDEQISTGKRVLNPSDDPVAAARILKLAQETAQIEQFQRGAGLAENRLQQEESTLASITDVVQRVRELTVQAGNGALSESDRKSVAAELRERLDQLGSLANTRDASGEYIFSGFKGNTPAFTQNISGDWVYQGDEGQRQLEIDNGVKVAISDNGKGLFVDIPSNNPTFFAEASSANTSNPPARISSGMVLDQEVFNGVYPADLVVQVDATAGTFTVTNRASGADLTPTPANYVSGESIRVAGIQFEITGAADGDSFVIKTAEKQSMFTTVEKLIYGLENQAKSPAVATIPAATFTPDGDDTLTINGVDFTGMTDVASLRDAINLNNDPATANISAELDGNGDLVITSLDGDLEFAADDGGTATGQMVVTGTKFEDLDLQSGPVTATVASGQQAFDELIANSLADLDNVQESILTTQTQIGGRLNAIETTRDFLTDSSVYTEQIRSEIQDVDYAEAVSRLSFQSFVLEAAQLSFAQVSRLSLFDKL
ncbi:flagellar hook-associated protein FlgL [Marinobacter sp. V034]|uniref:flagellar hook-associated protein FlgL n=1 Tax=Marinobacter sp. V034 TaxID=3459610 RepID=UPI004044F210